MKPRKAADVEAVLSSKGFRKDDTHHHFYWFFHNNLKTSIRTRISHGIKEYGTNLLSQVKKQIKLTTAELDKFLDCPMSGDEYAKLMIERKHVTVSKPIAAPKKK